MIIKTSRHPVFFSIDFLLTTFGWIAFAWLITKGVLSLTMDPVVATFVGINPVLPAISTLTAYLMVAAINAGLLALWAQSHRHFGRLRTNSNSAIDHFNSSSSSLYGIDPVKQKELRNNRFSVIYHNANGHITHVEAGS